MDCHGVKCNVIEYTRSIFPCNDNTRNVIASECEAIQNSVGLLAQATISNLFFAYVSFSLLAIKEKEMKEQYHRIKISWIASVLNVKVI